MNRTTRMLAPAAALAAGILCAAPGTGHAQTTPKVFFACYVPPLVGTMYRIKEPGLRTTCLLPSHVEFSWTDGVAANDHGALNGLADDDHPQYLLASGARPLTGNLPFGGFKITGLGAGTAAGDAVRFEQAVKVGDGAGGDLGGAYPNPGVVRLQGQPLSATAPTNGQVLAWSGTTWAPATLPTGPSGTPLNTPGTLIQRDATTGGFAAGQVDLTQLSVSGNATVGGSAMVGANASVGGAATVGGTINVGGNATIGGSVAVQGSQLSVSGNAAVSGNTNIGGNASIGGTATVSGNIAVGGTATVSGSAVVQGPELSVSGNATVNGNTTIGGSAAIAGSAAVGGTTTLSQLHVSGNGTVDGSATIGGNAAVGGNATVSGLIASAGGYRFGDGTIQTTAASGGSVGALQHARLTGISIGAHNGISRVVSWPTPFTDVNYTLSCSLGTEFATGMHLTIREKANTSVTVAITNERNDAPTDLSVECIAIHD